MLPAMLQSWIDAVVEESKRPAPIGTTMASLVSFASRTAPLFLTSQPEMLTAPPITVTPPPRRARLARMRLSITVALESAT